MRPGPEALAAFGVTGLAAVARGSRPVTGLALARLALG